MKELNISYSSTSCWKRCPEMFRLQYVLGVQAREEGASLVFGIALDNAINKLLLAIKNNNPIPSAESIKQIFVESEKGWRQALNNPKYKYTKADFDAKVLKQEDWTLINHFEKELGVSLEQARKAFNQKAFKRMSQQEDLLYCKAAWLSMKNKGFLMIEAFIKDILPQITEVISLQHKIEGRVGESKLVGYIDLICKLKQYDKPVVIDLKTAAMSYDNDSVYLSEQLILYLLYAGKQLNTTLAGFCVLLKGISSNIFCSICGQKKTTQHKTCNAVINGVRCNGEWSEVPIALTQLLINNISEDIQQKFAADLANLTSLMESGLYYMNRDSCKDFGLCKYYGLCHFKNLDEYIWKSEQDKQSYSNEE